MKKEAIDRFMSNMDKKLSITENVENAHLDANLYRWDKETLQELLNRITKAYRRHEDDGL